jgi:hypothetical protein
MLNTVHHIYSYITRRILVIQEGTPGARVRRVARARRERNMSMAGRGGEAERKKRGAGGTYDGERQREEKD